MDLVGVLNQFGFVKPVLIGEHLGCLPVVIVAAWYPTEVWRSILIDPTYAAGDGDSAEARALGDCPPDVKALRARVSCDLLELRAEDPALLTHVEAFLATPLP
jgi:hypothetical protein